jgi:hypothetical protein
MRNDVQQMGLEYYPDRYFELRFRGEVRLSGIYLRISNKGIQQCSGFNVGLHFTDDLRECEKNATGN